MNTLRILVVATSTLFGACVMSNAQPLEAIDRHIELERFMGDWYVIASIPIDLWFASEAGAHNAVENYALLDNGKIKTTYTFRRDGFDGEEEQFNPVGWVHNTETNAEWRMQFVWPFRSAYLIAWLDENYEHTIIGVPDRSHVWIMSRSPDIGEANYNRLIEITAELGHDTKLLQRIPHRW